MSNISVVLCKSMQRYTIFVNAAKNSTFALDFTQMKSPDQHNPFGFSSAKQMKSISLFCHFSQKKQLRISEGEIHYQYYYGHSTLDAFNGKEKDYESGFHYYGARYYWSEMLTGWLSVDPMADKNPSISPYAYCAWNPVKLVDPDGKWPWEPKHIRQARKFARQNDGYFSIEVKRNGVKLANVGYKASSAEFGSVFAIKSFAPEGYNSRGTIRKTEGITKFELWMDEGAGSISGSIAKGVCSFAYSFINEPWEFLTGHTLAGSDVNAEERSVAAISTMSAGLSGIIGKGAGIIKTKGDTGLDKYNNFVKRSGGRHGKTQKEMGNLYQNNKRIYSEYERGKKIFGINEKGISILNNSLNE